MLIYQVTFPDEAIHNLEMLTRIFTCKDVPEVIEHAALMLARIVNFLQSEDGLESAPISEEAKSAVEVTLKSLIHRQVPCNCEKCRDNKN
jgi:hypothetical protein